VSEGEREREEHFVVVLFDARGQKKLQIFFKNQNLSPVPSLPVVQPAMHPVDPPLNKAHVSSNQKQIRHNTADVPVYPREGSSHAPLREVFDERGQQGVEGHGLGRDLDLLEDRGARGHRQAVFFLVKAPGEERGAEDEVDVVDPDA
jgi:hypothetical protein